MKLLQTVLDSPLNTTLTERADVSNIRAIDNNALSLAVVAVNDVHPVGLLRAQSINLGKSSELIFSCQEMSDDNQSNP